MQARQLPPPATIRRSIKASVALMIVGLAMLIVPALRMPGLVLVIVFAGLALMGRRNLARAEADAGKQPVTVPPAADGAKMFEVLAMLEVPLDMGTTDPMNALLSGAAKAALHHGYSQLMSGQESEALSTLQNVAAGNHGRVSAAAHYLIGKVHAGKGRREQAVAAYQAALHVAPDYRLAQVALSGKDN